MNVQRVGQVGVLDLGVAVEGLEQEEPLTTQPERIRDDYLANLNAYLKALRAGCIGANVDYKLVDVSRPVDGVLNEFFSERSASLTGAAVGARA